jgi:hypothetical protein
MRMDISFRLQAGLVRRRRRKRRRRSKRQIRRVGRKLAVLVDRALNPLR